MRRGEPAMIDPMSEKRSAREVQVSSGPARGGPQSERHSRSASARAIVIAVLVVSFAGGSAGQDASRPTPGSPPAGSAAAPGPATPKATQEEFDLLENLENNLTVIRTRTDLLSEFTDRSNGWSEKLTLGSTFGFHLPGAGPEHEYGVRLQAPLVIVDPGSGPGSTETGLGDMELKTGWAFIPDPVNRMGVFGNFKFNTATDDLLGDNRNDYSLGVAGSHAVIPDRFTFFVLAEYLDTITHENGVSSRNALELSFNPIVRIAGPLAANLLFKDKLDFKADDTLALIEPGLSALLLERHLGLSTSIEIPLDDKSYDYIAKITVVWFY
jgi:hypothetical protein